MVNIDRKITKFINEHFPDIDYSTLGSNENKPEHRMGLNYEYFVNSMEYYSLQKTIDSENIRQLSTGNLRGIDACFFVLNKRFFFVPEMIETDELFTDWKQEFLGVIAKATSIDIDFHFIQSKSKNTKLDELKGFCDAVYDIFSNEENALHLNFKVKTIKFVYESVCKKEHTAKLVLKYCSVPKDIKQMEDLEESADWKQAIIKYKINLKSTKFEDVSIFLKSGQHYQDKLALIQSQNQKKYPINNLINKFVEIPTTPNVNCYLGYLNLSEIRELLTDDEGEDIADIFFDNIRYFEGLGSAGSINHKIYKSLSDNYSTFHTLHNGIVITAHSKHYNSSNGIVEIEAFSVINGCQTCNLVWLWIKDKENEIEAELDKVKKQSKQKEYEQKLLETKIPVKIVITSNAELRTQITEAANSQNDVESIQLISLSEEAKSLQNLFGKEVRQGETIYYERLSNQYKDVGNSYKLTTESVLRAFYSSFGKVPHKLTVGYGAFEKEKIKQKDFLATKNNGSPKYDINTFYTSSLLFNYLERSIRSQYASLISLKHHFLLLLFISIEKSFESINMDKKLDEAFIQKVKNLVSNKDEFNERVKTICEIAIQNFDFFIDGSGSKPKVKPKSYYSEEGTIKMVRIFKEKYFSNATN